MQHRLIICDLQNKVIKKKKKFTKHANIEVLFTCLFVCLFYFGLKLLCIEQKRFAKIFQYNSTKVT